VYRHHGDEKQAIDKKVANDTTITMKPIADFSGDGLAGGRQSAAKTGTAGISANSTGNSDAWMVGFTPQVSSAVWVGTGLRKPIVDANGNPEYGRDLPGQTWKAFMDLYLQGKPNLPLPNKQLIAANGQAPKPSPTKTVTKTKTASSSAPKPTFTITTGFPTPTPTKTSIVPPPSTSSPAPTTTSTCGLLASCSSSPAPGGAAGTGGPAPGG
jgi:membrane peptidoglycan carboxypeptidase